MNEKYIYRFKLGFLVAVKRNGKKLQRYFSAFEIGQGEALKLARQAREELVAKAAAIPRQRKKYTIVSRRARQSNTGEWHISEGMRWRMYRPQSCFFIEKPGGGCKRVSFNRARTRAEALRIAVGIRDGYWGRPTRTGQMEGER